MSTWPKLAAALLPGGLLALVAIALLRCRHRVEVMSRRPDGMMGLRCANCGRERAHPWSGERLAVHRTQERPALPAKAVTGIERQRAEDAEIEAAIGQMERREKREAAKMAVIRRFRV